jgi:hypothetical protein
MYITGLLSKHRTVNTGNEEFSCFNLPSMNWFTTFFLENGLQVFIMSGNYTYIVYKC